MDQRSGGDTAPAAAASTVDVSTPTAAAQRTSPFYQLYADVDTTDSEGEHEGPQHEHEVVEITPELLATVVKQVEFYFSDSNLPTDKKLLKQIRKDPQGFVPVKLFANFRKIRALTKDADVISMALRESQELVLSADQRCVKRRHPVPEYNITEITRRIVVVENIPPGHTIETMSELFSEYGHIKVVRICSRDSRGKLPGWMTAVCANSSSQQHAFVEYSDEHDAIKAAAATYGEDDSRHMLKAARLVTLIAALPPQLAAQQQAAMNPPGSPWKAGGDEGPFSARRSRAAATGSGRPSREPSPLGTRHSRLAPGAAGKPLGRSSVEHPAKGEAHVGHRAPGSSGGADSSSVWGHDGFHPSADQHKPRSRRTSNDMGHRPPPEARHWHHEGAHGHDAGHGAGAVNGAGAHKPGAYLPPGRRTADSHGSHESSHHLASGTCSPALSPASPRPPRARTLFDTHDPSHPHPSSYAAAAAAPTHPDDHPPAAGPVAPRHPLAVVSKPPASPSRSAPPVAQQSPRFSTNAALDAVLADVMASAGGLVVKAKDKEGEASSPVGPATGGDTPKASSGGGSAPASAAAAAQGKAGRQGSGGLSPSPSADEIGGLISKIITTPIVRCGSGDSSTFAAATAIAAAVSADRDSIAPAAVGNLITKILSDMPSVLSPTGAAAAAAAAERAAAGSMLKQAPAADVPAPAVPDPAPAAPSPAPPVAAAAAAGNEAEAERSSATSMGRQLSVVPEGNEFERLMSAQLDTLCEGMVFSGIDRELSLGLRDDAGLLALAAAAGSPQKAAARSSHRASMEASNAAGGTVTFTPPTQGTLPLPIMPGRVAEIAAGADNVAGSEGGSLPREGGLGGSSDSSDAEDGEGVGELGAKPRRRRTRRARRRSHSLQSASAASDGGDGSSVTKPAPSASLPPTVAEMRDGPRQRRASSGSAAGIPPSGRRMSDGSVAVANAAAAKGDASGSGSDAAKVKKHSKKDYASWAAATPEYRAEASARYGPGAASGSGSGAVAANTSPLRHGASPMASPPRPRRPSEGVYGHGDVHGLHSVHTSKGPDGSRGFAMGRGKPLSPPPR